MSLMACRFLFLSSLVLVGTFRTFAEEPVFKFDADRGEYQVFVREPLSLEGLSPLVKRLFRTQFDVVLLYPSIPDEEGAIRSAVREAKAYSQRAAAMEAWSVNALAKVGTKDKQGFWQSMKVPPVNAVELQQYLKEVPRKDLAIRLNLKTGALTLHERPLRIDAEK
jgi:hypothetical protein